MPSSMTHTYFGLDVLNNLPMNCQKKINNKIEYFKLFCQGSDPFMFYHFLLGKKAKEKMIIQSKQHKTNTRDFFINTIKIIQEKDLMNNGEVMSYLYGYICHYYLDLNTHPFIYYKSGLCKKNEPTTYKYNGEHQKLEYNIDLYMIKKNESITPHKYKVYKHIFEIKPFSKELTEVINKSFENTYHYQNITTTYISCIHYMKIFFKYINYDPTGIKEKIYKNIDKITKPTTIKLEELSYHRNFETNLSYLNLEHKPWTLPWDNTKIYTTSFFDLYEKAKKESINAITEVTNMLDSNELNEKKLHKLFKNLSYSTGRPCEEKLEMKYFEY